MALFSRSTFVFAAAASTAVGTIYIVHWQQHEERQVQLHCSATLPDIALVSEDVRIDDAQRSFMVNVAPSCRLELQLAGLTGCCM